MLSLCHIPETNAKLYFNYISIFKKQKKKRTQSQNLLPKVSTHYVWSLRHFKQENKKDLS